MSAARRLSRVSRAPECERAFLSNEVTQASVCMTQVNAGCRRTPETIAHGEQAVTTGFRRDYAAGRRSCKANIGVSIAMCRFFIVSAIWLGLLGAAEPVLACAMNSRACECCPTGAQSSCRGDSGQAGAIRDAHQQYCASAPIGEMLEVSIRTGDAKLSPVAPGAANPPLIRAPADRCLVFSPALAYRPRFADSAPSFGALTYLRTGRLRL